MRQPSKVRTQSRAQGVHQSRTRELVYSWRIRKNVGARPRNNCFGAGALPLYGGPRVYGRNCTYYPLSDVKKACARYLRLNHQSDRGGFLRIGGKLYGLMTAISLRLGLSKRAVASRIRPTFKKQWVKSSTGRRLPVYLFTEVKKACAVLLWREFKAGRDGFFSSDGEQWGSRNGIARRLGISGPTISLRLKRCRRRKGKNACNQPGWFYSLSDAKKAFAGLMKNRVRVQDLVTRSHFGLHAKVLSRILFVVRKKNPNITSDQLWKSIQKHWTAKRLAKEAAAFRKTKRVTRFQALLAA